MMYLEYFLTVLFATTIGATSGIGGGVIIKPLLGILNDYPVLTINMLSSISVFSMAIVSTYKSSKKGYHIFERKYLYIYIGSFIGGILGSNIFLIFTKNIPNGENISSIQALILIILIMLSLIFKYKNASFNFKETTFICLALGILTGVISAFLGIGGGPINMMFLILFFNYSIVDSAVISITLILFSQFANIVNTFLINDIHKFELNMLIVMIPAAVIGGILGSRLKNILTEKNIDKIYIIVMIFIIIINIFNIF